MLKRLSEISTDTSSEGRRALLNTVTDLFLIDDKTSETARDHYTEIAKRSIDQMGSADKANYTERVAAEAKLPGAIARRLASDDELTVAQLVLRLSPVLTDADLASIAVTHSQAHLVAIAERATLSENVTDVLVERGDRKVLRTVSGNEGAAFSEDGLDTLIRRGDGDARITHNLAGRSDSLPASQARRVLKIAELMSAASASSLETEIVAGSSGHELASKARERRLEVRLLIADLKEGKRAIDDIVELLVKDDRAFDLAQVVSSFSDIPNSQALRALLQKEATGIAVACRAMGLGSGAFRAVLRLRAGRLGIPAKRSNKDFAIYESLNTEMSERTMRFLKIRSKLS